MQIGPFCKLKVALRDLRQELDEAPPTPAPAVPPRTLNSSFLHSSMSSGTPPPSLYTSSQPGRPPPPLTERPAPSCRTDTLADLDPLRARTEVAALQPRAGLLPPTVPPRGKKQWTTFD